MAERPALRSVGRHRRWPAPSGFAGAVVPEALTTIRDEPGTLQHDWFFSDDGARCVVRETYASSEAFFAHLTVAGTLLGRPVELGGGLELFGEPSAAVRDAVAAFQPRIHRYSQGK